jgi:hypothetical protein
VRLCGRRTAVFSLIVFVCGEKRIYVHRHDVGEGEIVVMLGKEKKNKIITIITNSG